jgi:hypothetical protein
MTAKNPKTKTIEVSTETYERIHSAKANIAKILGKKSVSFDTAFKLFFACKPLDTMLSEMVLETAREAS